MSLQPGIIELFGLAASISLLAGWRLYLCMFATGLAMRHGMIPLPDSLASLQVLASPWVIGVAALIALAEFLADKIAWFDSLWDTLHTLIRPIGGALLAMAIIDPSDPVPKVVVFVLGGGAALAAHVGKVGERALVNASPGRFSNVVVSIGEDVAAGGLLLLAYLYPVISVAIALLLLALVAALLLAARRLIGRLAADRRQNIRN